MESCSDFHSSPKIKLTDLGDALTFPLAPSLGQNLNLPNIIPGKHQQSRIHSMCQNGYTHHSHMWCLTSNILADLLLFTQGWHYNVLSANVSDIPKSWVQLLSLLICALLSSPVMGLSGLSCPLFSLAYILHDDSSVLCILSLVLTWAALITAMSCLSESDVLCCAVHAEVGTGILTYSTDYVGMRSTKRS